MPCLTYNFRVYSSEIQSRIFRFPRKVETSVSKTLGLPRLSVLPWTFGLCVFQCFQCYSYAHLFRLGQHLQAVMCIMTEATLCSEAEHQCVPTAVITCLQSNTASVMQNPGSWSCCYLSQRPTQDPKLGILSNSNPGPQIWDPLRTGSP